MSNSAFTPTTTQVTTEVPVNVPIVTAWEAYTPTFEGFGTPTSVSVLWRRVGDNIQVTGNFTSGIPTSSTASISLPSGLNLDSTKINGPGQTKIFGFFIRANSTSTPFPANTRGPFVVTESKNSSTSKVYLSFTANTSAGGVFEVAGGTNILGSGELLTFEFNAPISQWSSGTTTLATRAVEEYAWNSDETASSNTSSFSYGADGVLFPNITGFGATVTKRVRFNSSILSTDSVIVEYQRSSSGPWRNAAQRIPLTAASSSTYGIEITNVSLTDIDVAFMPQGAVQAGLTYGANGEAWSAYRTANWKWRVRKVSGGAAVGFPVSARNIVGDTSGSVVPTGMLGENTTIATASGVNIGSGSNVFITGLTQTLSAGTWMLIADGTVSVTTAASGMTSGQNAAMDLRIQNTTDATTAASITSVSFVQALSATTVCGGAGSFSLTAVLNLTSQKTFQVQGTYQSNINGGSTQIVRSGRFYAVRIA
jgi:hypothetical protein